MFWFTIIDFWIILFQYFLPEIGKVIQWNFFWLHPSTFFLICNALFLSRVRIWFFCNLFQASISQWSYQSECQCPSSKKENKYSHTNLFSWGKQPIKRSDEQIQQSPRRKIRSINCAATRIYLLPAFLAVIRDDVNICNARDLKPAMRPTRNYSPLFSSLDWFNICGLKHIFF